MMPSDVPPRAPLPVALRLNVQCPLDTPLAVAADACIAAAGVNGGLAAWRLGGPAGVQGDDAGTLRQAVAAVTSGRGTTLQVTCVAGLALTASPLEGFGAYVVDSTWIAGDRDGARQWLRQAVAAIEALVPRLPADLAEIAREPHASSGFLPSPPLLRRRHAWVTDDAEPRAVYGDAAPSFLAAWDEVRECGGRRLLLRALEAIDEAAWVEQVLPSQLRMAKRAPPGQTEWRRATAAPWNVRWVKGARPHLGFVGQDAATGLVEFAATVGEDGLGIAELQMLSELKQRGTDAQGRQVGSVRVVYPDVASALIDATVLADLGIGCFAMDEAGRTVPVANVGSRAVN